MAVAEITTDFNLDAPLEVVWRKVKDPTTMKYWHGVARVQVNEKETLIIGELKLPIGGAVQFKSKLSVEDAEMTDGHAKATVKIESPSTSLIWNLEPNGEAATHCGLVVEYSLPGGPLGRVLPMSMLEKVIGENVRLYVRGIRSDLQTESAGESS